MGKRDIWQQSGAFRIRLLPGSQALGSCFNQSGKLILGKATINASVITNWFLGFGLCNQFAKFCFVFGV